MGIPEPIVHTTLIFMAIVAAFCVMQLFLRCLGVRPPASRGRRAPSSRHTGLQQGRHVDLHVDRARPLPVGWILLLAPLALHVDAPVAPAVVSDLRGRGQRHVGAAGHLPERGVVLSIVLYICGFAVPRGKASILRPPSRGADASLRDRTPQLICLLTS